MVKRQYLNIKGKICSYVYLVSEMNHKPKCTQCGYRMKKIYHRYINGGIRENLIGYICEDCNVVVILGSYTVLKGILQ